MRCARPDQNDQTRDRKCEKGGTVGSNTIWYSKEINCLAKLIVRQKCAKRELIGFVVKFNHSV